MKTTLFLLLAFLAALPAHAVQGKPSVITFDDPGASRFIYAFVKGDNGHLVSHHFNGTSWVWTDHGLPPGSTSVNNPKAVTYLDAAGKRRIYVFAVDGNGHLVIRFHKGAGFAWQWSTQGGPNISGSSLSATAFVDDTGVQQIHAFALRSTNDPNVPFRLVNHFWDGSAWNWADMKNFPGEPTLQWSFTETTNYIGNDSQRRMDVFVAANEMQVLLRYSRVNNVWNDPVNLGGQADRHATVINYTNASGYRQVNLFAKNPASLTWWVNTGSFWTNLNKPLGASQFGQGAGSATVYKDTGGYPRINLYVEWDGKLYLKPQNTLSWQPWVDLGKPAGSGTLGIRDPAAITYPDIFTGNHLQWVFVTAPSNEHLYAATWNGNTWQWSDRGNN